MARILIAEDSPADACSLMAMLSSWGHEVFEAADGESAVRLARRVLPHLVIMDIVMPVKNGFQATRLLRHDRRTHAIPVVIASRKDQQADREWGVRQGASAYLVKPVKRPELSELLNKLLARPRPAAVPAGE